MNKHVKSAVLAAMAAMILNNMRHSMADANGKVFTDDTPKRTCKDCYFYNNGTYCKLVKHHINRDTPANNCGRFKNK